MRTFAIIILLLTYLACNDVKENHSKGFEKGSFYIGTYTDGESKGIYKCSFTESGQFDNPRLVAEADNPSFLAFSSDQKYLFAVNELNKEEEGGFVSGFQVQKDTLIFLNSSPSGGGHPCYIAVHESGYVLTANYTGGTIGLLQHDSNGFLTDILDAQQHVGSGDHERQNEPHAHTCRFEPGSDHILSVDLGTNELWFSKINADSLRLVPLEQEKLQMAPGAGPRHLAFHPLENWIYVINELNSSITRVFRKDDGLYRVGESIPTLPDRFEGTNFCADIHISADGRFVYASNRGHNSIAIYSIMQDSGELQLIGHESVRGDWPRNFSISPNQNHLLVANQRSNNVISFRRDITSGTLTYLGELKVPNPVCVLFD